MTDHQLECIVAIANTGNITAAAKTLFVSQSSLSQLLAGVEKELGVQLFDRNASPLTPTYAGEQFLQAARRVLEIRQDLTYKIADLNHSCRGRIVIGISQKRSWLFMPVVLSAFMKQYPEVEIVFLEDDQQHLDELVLNGKVDIAFTTQPRLLEELEYHFLYREYMLLALPGDHPLCDRLAEGDAPDLRLLADVPFILNHEGHDIRAMCDRIFADFGIHPRVLLESHSMDVCFQMAAYGLGAAIIPDTLAKDHPFRDRVRCFRIGAPYSRNVVIAYRKNMYLSFIMQEFIAISTKQILDKYGPEPKEI